MLLGRSWHHVQATRFAGAPRAATRRRRSCFRRRAAASQARTDQCCSERSSRSGVAVTRDYHQWNSKQSLTTIRDTEVRSVTRDGRHDTDERHRSRPCDTNWSMGDSNVLLCSCDSMPQIACHVAFRRWPQRHYRASRRAGASGLHIRDPGRRAARCRIRRSREGSGDPVDLQPDRGLFRGGRSRAHSVVAGGVSWRDGPIARSTLLHAAS
jgi:hypothetical protein